MRWDVALGVMAVSSTAAGAPLKLPWKCGDTYMITQDGSGCGWDGCSVCNTIGDHGSIPGSLDFGIPANTELRAAAAGTVAYVWMPTQPGDACYGGSLSCCGGSKSNYIVIDHGDGTSTLYMHINQALVGVGAWVEQGQAIALSGSTGCSTGPHLHFQLQSACGGSWWCPTQWPSFSDWGGGLGYCDFVTSGNCGGPSGCTPGCDGDSIVNADCTTADCGAYAAYCSALGGSAHCISKFCVPSADQVPWDHDVCVPGASLGRCTADGGLEQIQCPEAKGCLESPYGGYCEPPLAASAGVKRWITSGAAWDEWKFSGTDIVGMPADQLNAFPDGAALPDTPKLVREAGTLEVYLVDGTARRWVQSETALAAWHLDAGAVQELSSSEIAQWPVSTPFRVAPYLGSAEPFVVYVIDDPTAGADGGASSGGAPNSGGAGGWSGNPWSGNGGTNAGGSGAKSSGGAGGKGGKSGSAGVEASGSTDDMTGGCGCRQARSRFDPRSAALLIGLAGSFFARRSSIRRAYRPA